MTINEGCAEVRSAPEMVRVGKSSFLENAQCGLPPNGAQASWKHAKEDALYGEIGRLKMESGYGLKKVRSMSMKIREWGLGGIPSQT